MHRFLNIFFLACLAGPISTVFASPSQDELEKWFSSDSLEPPSKGKSSQLTFISAPADKPALHSINTISISADSLITGWVDLSQCYKHLDAVPDMEVSYQYKNMRKLKIISTQNIQRAYVKGASIQLVNVQRNASLCMNAEVKIFYKNHDGTYQLVNGPYHRQFLDSFFPYHLTMNIHYPSSLLTLVSSIPKQQPGFIINKNPGIISFDTYFTGKLFTKFIFKTP